jgi:hypothetical protein
MPTDWTKFKDDVLNDVEAQRERKRIPDRFTVDRVTFLETLERLNAQRHGPERSRCVIRCWLDFDGPAGSLLRVELIFNTYLRVGDQRWYGRAGEWNEVDIDRYETHVKGKGARGRYADTGEPPYSRVHRILWEMTRR